ncbi:MAG: hemerythrin domain-containing protein [Xanthomonadaceae bacterium]|nr:hemerythrin domain-containing protein [Xanthomonadaceae bacterium]MDE3071124.1 hemerythrin domain-containing protein [Pseudomonadota bacterium]
MLTDFLTADHGDCDELFAKAENAAADGDRAVAQAAYAGFEAAMERHLSIEETVLFPEFEARSGMVGGPTAVMRMEHGQIRAMMAQLRQALEDRELDDFLGLSETLHILIQQHNMKEEQMLYPLCDSTLADRAQILLERMQAY